MTGDEMKAARVALGLTQAELGQWLGLSGGKPGHTVFMWETGKRPISGTVAVLLTLFAGGVRPPHLEAAAK